MNVDGNPRKLTKNFEYLRKLITFTQNEHVTRIYTFSLCPSHPQMEDMFTPPTPPPFRSIKSIRRFNNYKFSILEGVKHLMDTNFNHYALQLNLYKYILESQYRFRVRNMYIVCLHPENKNNDYLVYSVPKLEKEIEIIILIVCVLSISLLRGYFWSLSPIHDSTNTSEQKNSIKNQLYPQVCKIKVNDTHHKTTGQLVLTTGCKGTFISVG